METSFKTCIALAVILLAGFNSYASVKQLSGDRTNNWNTSNSSYVGSDSTTYEYNGSGKVTLEHGFTYNSSTGWKETSQTVYTYSSGLLTNKTIYSVTTGTQVNSFKVDYTYNTINQILTETSWLWVSGAWFGIYRYATIYDSGHYIDTYTTQNWVAATGTWRNVRRIQYNGSYNNHVAMTEIHQTWNSTLNAWINYERMDHFYYPTFVKDSELIASYWDAVNSSWKLPMHTIYTYNSIHSVTKAECFEWNSTATTLVPVWKNTYIYGGDILTFFERENYNGTAYVPVSCISYTLDANHHYYEQLEMIWDDTSSYHHFVNSKKYIFDYDYQGDLLHDVSQDWSGTGWVNNPEHYYWYASTVSAVEEIAETKSLKVFPNPFMQMATVEFSLNESAEATIYVYDLSGKRITEATQFFNDGTNQWTLDGSELNSGFYFVKIETGSEKFIQKIVKM